MVIVLLASQVPAVDAVQQQAEDGEPDKSWPQDGNENGEQQQHDHVVMLSRDDGGVKFMRKVSLTAALVLMLAVGPALAGFFLHGQVTIATTATKIVDAHLTRRAVVIVNEGTTDVRVGNSSGVLTTTGALLTGTKGAQLTIEGSGAVWAIVGTGTQAVSYIEMF